MTCGFMRLETLQLQKSIRMEITIFKIFIWGGISSDIRPCKTIFPTVYPTIYLPNENFEYSYPQIVCLPGILWLIHVLFWGSPSPRRGLVCSVLLWYFLIILAVLNTRPGCLVIKQLPRARRILMHEKTRVGSLYTFAHIALSNMHTINTSLLCYYSGIGRGIAIKLAELGAKVVAVARTQEDLDSLQREVISWYGGANTLL